MLHGDKPIPYIPVSLSLCNVIHCYAFLGSKGTPSLYADTHHVLGPFLLLLLILPSTISYSIIYS